jgi:hypothetical protein
LEGTTFKLHANSLFLSGTGPVLEPVAASFNRLSKPFIRVEVLAVFSVLRSIFLLKGGQRVPT